MANTLDIVEVTLAQIADSTHAVNTDDRWDFKKVVRVTDHADNDGTETGDNTDKMALFECQARGKPWQKCDNTLEKIIHEPTDGLTPATDVNVVFPNWDYTKFQ